MSEPWKRVERIGDATLYLGDCLEILPTLGPVDAVVTDPDYGVGIRYGEQPKRNAAGMREHVDAILELGLPTAVCCPVLRQWDMPRPQWVAVWHKPMSFGFWQTPLYPHWEPILLFNMRGKSMEQDWFSANPEKPNGHPTPKPVELMQYIIGFMPGSVVLDPFMGSGTTGVACINLGRRFIGIEIEPKYFGIACKRIRAAYAQPRLFEDKPAPAKQLELEGT